MKEVKEQNDEVVSGLKKQIEDLQLDMIKAKDYRFDLKSFKE